MSTESLLKVVGLSGALSSPSRTTTLVSTFLDKFSTLTSAQVSLLTVAELAPVLAKTLDPRHAPAQLQQAIATLAEADILVISSPVYKGSYTGLFKHFIDLLDPKLLKNKVVILSATGGTDLHGLVLEHQLRPLFSFFGTVTVPTTLYLRDTELVKDESHQYLWLTAEPLQRIDAIVRQSLLLATGQQSFAVAPTQTEAA